MQRMHEKQRRQRVIGRPRMQRVQRFQKFKECKKKQNCKKKFKVCKE